MSAASKLAFNRRTFRAFPRTELTKEVCILYVLSENVCDRGDRGHKFLASPRLATAAQRVAPMGEAGLGARDRILRAVGQAAG